LNLLCFQIMSMLQLTIQHIFWFSNRFSHLKMVDALEGGFLPSLPILDLLEHEHAADD
jgi:hypothetical protein